MREAQRVIVDGAETQSVFPVESELTAVFFTTELNDYLDLKRVDIDGNTINIAFKLIPKETEDAPSYFALIPLGKLPTGEYHVNMVNSSDEQEWASSGRRPRGNEFVRRCICNPFSFTVGSKAK